MPPQPREESYVLSFDDVVFAYGSGESARRALDGVTLSVEPGCSVTVVGPNGSGKSTLARLSNGLLAPTSGSVTVDGREAADQRHAREVRTSVGLVFQRPDDQIVATSVEDDVAFGPENLGLERAEIRSRVDAALADVGLTGLEQREPHLLSGGQKQRLAIAGALAMSPTYLVMDEPTSMLDPRGRREVLDVIERLRSAGHGLLVITHDLVEVVRADVVIVLVDGSVVFRGTPAEVFSHSASELSEWGIEMPQVVALVQEMRRLGSGIPLDTIDPAKIATWVCR